MSIRAIVSSAFAVVVLHGADDGFVWHRVAGVHDAVRPYPSAVDPDTVYVWTEGGLVATHDGGTTFAALPLPLAPALGEITAMLVTPNRASRLIVGTAERGVFVSQDSGTSWSALGGVDQGLAHARIRCLAFAPEDPDYSTIYATHSRAEPGISLTIDGGKTWRAFASDYGVDELIPCDAAIFFSGRSASQGDGFFRHDADRGWICVLTEPPRALVVSPLAPERVWFGTQGSGLRVSDDFGVSMREQSLGPREADVVSIAVCGTSPSDETIYAFDPTGEGVMRSRDGFATWERLGDGFPPSAWTREGASMVADAAGHALYACRNGELYRGAPANHGPLLSAPRCEPAAVVAEVEAIRFSCRAASGTAITVDCGALGGPAAFPLAEVGGGLYAATLERARPAHAGRIALPVSATHDAERAHAFIQVTVLPHLVDTMLWNGEGAESGTTTKVGGVAIDKAAASTPSPTTHLRVKVDGAGRAGFAWSGQGPGVDASHHKLLRFAIRSDLAGAPHLRIAVRDDGQVYGQRNGQTSNEVELSRYLPRVGDEYRSVVIPIADLVFGSTASPAGLHELIVIADGSEKRVYDIDDISLLARREPRLSHGEARLLDDDRTASIAVTAESDSLPLRAVTARIGDADFPLFDDGQHGDGAAGDARWAAQVPIDRIGRGTHAITFRARDDETDATLAYDVGDHLVRWPAGSRLVDDGFIREFLVGEVRPGIDPTQVDQPLIDETVHPSRAGGWKFVATEGAVDLAALIGGTNIGAHAHVYVWSERARTVQLWIGSDDGLRVAVNGQCVHQFAGARGVTPDQDRVPNVKLNEGWNDVLLLVTQGNGGWGFCLRIRDDQGNAAGGLSYAADR